MGLWDSIRSMFSKRGSGDRRTSAASASNPSQEILVYDDFGRQLRIPRREWQQKVLPGQIERYWNDPDGLYSTIVAALDDGFHSEVLEASRHLMDIDPNRERSHVVRGIVLMTSGNLDGAEEVLSAYIQQNGATGTVLTNLAKVHSARGQHEKPEATLWESLRLDPNQDNGLLWWAALHRDRSGEAGFLEAMRQVAEVESSWRPQLWLARDCLKRTDLDEAMRLYHHVLQVAADEPDVLMMISGDLGNNGRTGEILRLVAPIYDPQKHGPYAGFNILEACLQEQDCSGGKSLLERMFALKRPDLKDRLLHYAAEFDKRSVPTTPATVSSEKPLDVAAVQLDRPIWAYGLNDPKWLFPSMEGRKGGIALVSLANTTPTGLREPSQQREDDLGRLTRSIPLYLTESIFFWTNLRPTMSVPVVMGAGPVVSGMEWPPDQLLRFAEGIGERAISGHIRQAGEELIISLSVWDCQVKSVTRTIQRPTHKDRYGDAVLDLETELLEYLAPGSSRAVTPKEAYYVRPGRGAMVHYLMSLG